MTEDRLQPALGESLRAERRRRRLSLRELADEIDVGFNTLSRVERGHVPELRNYKRIISWLGAEDSLFDAAETAAVEPSTPDLIAKHLYTDDRLDEESAGTMMKLIQDLYNVLAAPKPAFAVHLRSSQTFLPEVGKLLSDALEDMHTALVEEAR
ncbi:helix-turn-helix domain-containing protein [Nocardioides sp. T5]|uniref:helix-turn-helix domain-containing protein n=1 Tax=Nocardioides sp. T5 TaxID=3400182 RepID=UPI003A8C3011